MKRPDGETSRPLPDADATQAAAVELADRLGPGDVVALVGPLGAGKTTFVKSAAAALGVSEEVTSPTFIRLRHYEGDLEVHHLDLYRVQDAAEFQSLGLDEWLDTAGVTLIEWADRAAEVLPPDTITVFLDYADGARSRTMRMREGPPRPGEGT
ncbi:MAG: tRNA (adenosine(37)-N6)-threonylcarbamoyltransferase complex ATPase subunit type 1 TsaE [bacterium]